MEWLVFLEKVEWLDKTKTDYYLAQIAAEIRQFREGFSNSPKSISIQDCLIPFQNDTGEQPVTPAPTRAIETGTKAAMYEAGPELVKDPKWAAVNAKAKAHWASLCGVRDLTELQNGG